MNIFGTVCALSVSTRKGIAKSNVPSATFVADWGIDGDAHAGPWHRQVSLLAMESIDTMLARGAAVTPGAFAENITTMGIDIPRLPVGTRLTACQVVLEVTQIGKECHQHCAIYHQVGDCVMPREGIFTRVLMGGTIHVGATIAVTLPSTAKETGCTNHS
jgi:MOSC domain-containing protein YiiM